MQRNNRALRVLVLATAGLAVIPAAASAQSISGGTGQQYLISTTGATALAAFTTTAGNVFGPILYGGTTPFTIGGTTYTPSPSGAVSFGNFTNETSAVNVTSGLVLQPGNTADRLVYSYQNLGSINGIVDLAITNGVLTGTNNFAISGTNPIFVSGAGGFAGLVGQPGAASVPTRYTNYFNNSVAASTGTVPILGGKYQTEDGRKAFPQIAYSDVRTRQAFAQAGTSSPNAVSLASGYGNGEPSTTSGKNPAFQQLRQVAGLTGGLDPATTRLRNDSLAVVPFTIAANPGTGLAQLKEADFAMLNLRGRLPNGANFNYVTRDIGSGTRNQGANNVDLDPTWAGGERDRRYYGTFTYTANNDGILVAVNPGDEQAPLVRQVASSGTVGNESLQEHRPSALMTYADKTSGTTGLRAAVYTNRMALGILSGGDAGSDGRLVTSNTPLRVLGVQWKFDAGEQGSNTEYTQPTASNVAFGRYKLWSSSQAVTVAGSLATGAARTGGVSRAAVLDTNTTTGRGILNDVDDTGTGTGPGVVRKFLDNITTSIKQGFPAGNAFTPLDQLVLAGFIPPTVMNVDKTYDGAPQFANSAFDSGLYADAVTNGPLNTTLNWANPSLQNGGSGQAYGVYDLNNTTAIGNQGVVGTRNFSIPLNDRLYLAGDLNGDGVRDLADAASFGSALANPTAFLTADTTLIGQGVSLPTGAATGLGTLDFSGVATPIAKTVGSVSYSATIGQLVALTDLNGDGNVEVRGFANTATATGDVAVAKPAAVRYTVNSAGQVVAASTDFVSASRAWLAALGTTNTFGGTTTSSGSASPIDRVVAVSRADVEYFIFGAAIDTSTVDLDETTAGVQNAAFLLGNGTSAAEVARLRREVGVRSGVLRIASAASAVNSAIDASTLTLAEKANLKFEIRDVDQSGSRAFANATTGDFNFLSDAFLLDAVAGKDYTSTSTLTGVLSTPVDLPRFALSDANTVIGQDDMNVLDDALTTTAGVNDAGRVDQAWGASFVKPGNLSIVVKPKTGTITVTPGATLTVGQGNLTVSGYLASNASTGAIASINPLVDTAAGRTVGGPAISLTVSGTGSVKVDALKSDRGTGSKAAVTVLGGLSIAGSGFVDLTVSDLVVRGGNVTALRSAVSTWLSTGTSGLGTTGTFFGIASGIAGTSLTTLGVFPNTGGYYTSYNDVDLAASDVLVKFTFIGDTNIDGTLDAIDLVNILEGLNNGFTGWQNGDVNYDGVVNSTDLSEYRRVLAAITFGNGQGDFGNGSVGSASGAIPEPSALGLLAAGLTLVTRRRRK